VDGGRRWTRTSGLLHVKHFRLSAVLGVWEAEQNRVSYAVTDLQRQAGFVGPHLTVYEPRIRQVRSYDLKTPDASRSVYAEVQPR
jgi:hypothetical protein